MKNVIIVLSLLMAIQFSGCKKMKSWFSKKNDTTAVYIKKLEMKLKEDEIKHSDQLKQLQESNKAFIDSLQSACATKAEPTGMGYHVITGAFENSEYAEKYKEKMNADGYTATVITGVGSYNLVSVKTTEKLREALNSLEDIRGEVTENAWIYVNR